MKYVRYVFIAVILALSWATIMHSQQPTAAPKKLTQAQQDHIDVAIKDFQLAQAQLNALQQGAAVARQNALDRIAEVKKEMKLDETWDYDEQQKAFVKKPDTVKPAESNK